MEFLEFILHAETHLRSFIQDHGAWIYILLFLIIFCETGLVVTPILPGDSLLFAVGALAAEQLLDLNLTLILLCIAGITGNSLNYAIGRWLGPKVFHYERSRWFNPQYLQRTHAFYEKHGGQAIVLARFIPIVRTFAPFVAGIGNMHAGKFLFYNVIGCIAWIAIFLYAGFYAGSLPFVQNNFKILVLIIIIVSFAPLVYGVWKTRKELKHENQ
ncbi:MAG: DedA family protein [Gammaproteobacteria bacterium]|nr:DedA family protein [Gammaproteobacteria bacterium]